MKNKNQEIRTLKAALRATCKAATQLQRENEVLKAEVKLLKLITLADIEIIGEAVKRNRG